LSALGLEYNFYRRFFVSERSRINTLQDPAFLFFLFIAD
jgi:hypothetical protein